MFASSFQTSDITGSAFAATTMGSLAAAALMALGLTWVSERWRIPVALAAVALGISALFYMSADDYGSPAASFRPVRALRHGLRFSHCSSPPHISSPTLRVRCRQACSGGLHWPHSSWCSVAISAMLTSSIRLSASCFPSPSGSTSLARCISAEWPTSCARPRGPCRLAISGSGSS